LDRRDLYSKDRQTYFERDAAERLTAIAYSGGDPNSTDPNSTSINTLSYRQTVGYAYGTEASQAFDGVSWKSKDVTIDPSSGLIRSAHCRPTMSFTPPAENGTTSLIGRFGNALCANAGEANAAADARGQT
jgi:hypothetical protein